MLVQPEVFALNNLLAAGLLLLVTMWYDEAGTEKEARSPTARRPINHRYVAKVKSSPPQRVPYPRIFSLKPIEMPKTDD